MGLLKRLFRWIRGSKGESEPAQAHEEEVPVVEDVEVVKEEFDLSDEEVPDPGNIAGRAATAQPPKVPPAQPQVPKRPPQQPPPQQQQKQKSGRKNPPPSGFTHAMGIPAVQPTPKKAPQSQPTTRRRAPRGVVERPGIDQPPVEYRNDPEHKKALRIARGQLSDLKEYHMAELIEAVKKDNFEQRFAEELRDLRQSYDKRIKPEVNEIFDYFDYAIENLKADVREQEGF